MDNVFTSGEVMSLLESMSDGIQLIAEAQSGTNDRLDSMENRLDGLEQRFDTLEQKVDRLQDDMTDVKQSLATKVDRTEFSKLEKRMVKVERVVFDGAKVR
jgi:archaellum component FlaC